MHDAQNAYLFSVLDQKVLTTRGRVILRKHATTLDAQAALCELVDAYSSGTSAAISIDKLRKSIISFTLDDKWNKPITKFLGVWTNKIMDLERLTGHNISDDDKRTWITASLRPHKEMYTAVTQARTFEFYNGDGMKFDSFYAILESTAMNIDDLWKAKHSNRSRQANQNNQNRQGNKNNNRNHSSSGNQRNNSSTQSNNNVTLDPNKNYSKDEYSRLTPAQKKELYQKRKDAGIKRHTSNRQANSGNTTNNTNTTSQQQNTTSMVPLQVNVSDTQSVSASTIASAPPRGSALRSMLSNAAAHKPSTATQASNDTKSVTVYAHDGKIYQEMPNIQLQTNKTNIQYHIEKYEHIDAHIGALTDGGANGGLGGTDCLVLEEGLAKADVTGIANNTVEDLPICTVASKIETSSGYIIGIFHQYAYLGKGKSVHSCCQLRAFGLDVNDVPRGQKGGTQLITTPEGYKIPLSVRNGLCYLDQSKPSPDDLDTYPHVFFTSDTTWDPSVYDNEFTASDLEDDCAVPSYLHRVDEYGRVNHEFAHIDIELYDHALAYDTLDPVSHPAKKDLMLPPAGGFVLPKHPDYASLRPNLGWISADRVKATLQNTTQHYKADSRLPLRKHFKSRFPAANVHRIHEEVSTDTFFSDVPAHDDGIPGHGGCTMLQLFSTSKSNHLKGYPLKSEAHIPKALEDYIRDLGAPTCLRSDNAKAACSTAVEDILRLYNISHHTSEPHHQQQNPVERHVQEIKKMTNSFMDRHNTPSAFWLLCTLFCIGLHNHLALPSLGNKTPEGMFTHTTADISKYIQFHWWEPVYFRQWEHGFPSDSPEKVGLWCGPSDDCGDILTYQILDVDTLQVVHRSAIRSAKDSANPNLRALLRAVDGEISAGEPTDANPVNDPFPHVVTVDDIADFTGLSTPRKLPRISPHELLGMTYLKEKENGEKVRARVVKKINDDDAANHHNIKFLLELGDGETEEIISYVELSDIIEQQIENDMNNPDHVWFFKQILDHQGPLKPKDPGYNGSTYNLKVLWDDGSETWEPLSIIAKDDPVTCAVYGKQNGLLSKPGWKRLKLLPHVTRNSKDQLMHLRRRQEKDPCSNMVFKYHAMPTKLMN